MSSIPEIINRNKVEVTPSSRANIRRQKDLDAARQYAHHSRSDSTWRTYSSAWEIFENYCQTVDLVALPAKSDTVAMFVAAEAEKGKAVSTIRHRLSAIRLMHLGNGFASPHNTQAVVEVLRGVQNSRKEEGELPNRKAPLADETIKRLIDKIDLNSKQGLRDRALLLYGFAGALRRSELVGINISHIEVREKGHLLTIPYSKGDQSGKGQKIAILAQPESPYCPVVALEAWMAAAKIHNGAIFRRVYRGDSVGEKRLGDRAVAELIKNCIYKLKDSSLKVEYFSAHSLRRGFLTSASNQKADIFKLVAQSRHKQLDTVLNYVEEQEKFESHAAERLLLNS